MLLRRFIELLTPVSCLECGADGAVLCAECVTRNAGLAWQRCFRCGLPAVGGATCERCVVGAGLQGVSVGARYDGAVKDMIWQLKFSRLRMAAEPAAELVARALPPDMALDVVTAVPIAPDRYRERGYNQAELIARAVARQFNLRYIPLLARTDAVHQVGRGRQERLAQIKGAFYARRGLAGERVLIVDDVITTGATLGECARMLLEVGAGEVWGGAVARH
jgi:ComF family protein